MVNATNTTSTHEEDFRGPVALFCIMLTLFVGAIYERTRHLFGVPASIALMAYGALFGIGAAVDKHWQSQLAIVDVNPDLILHLFLPVLIFDGTVGMKLKVLNSVKVDALFLAGPGVIFGAFATAGLGMALYPSWSFLQTLLLGAIVAATDPVAVIAVLHDLEADPWITVLTDSEAIMNDGAAIVLFSVVKQTLEKGIDTLSAGDVVVSVLRFTLLPIPIGIGFGIVIHYLSLNSLTNPIVTGGVQIAGSYIMFYVAEHLSHTSGVLTLLVAGIFIARQRGRHPKSDAEGAVRATWNWLVWVGNTLLFSMVGFLIVVKTTSAISGAHDTPIGTQIGNIFLLYLFLNALRGVLFLMVWPIVDWVASGTGGEGMTWRRWAFLSFGGLRGGIAMVLGLATLNNHKFDHVWGSELFLQVAGIVVLTSVFNGWMAGPMVNLLKLNSKEVFSFYAMRLALQELKYSMAASIENLKRTSCQNQNTVVNWLFVRLLSIARIEEFVLEVEHEASTHGKKNAKKIQPPSASASGQQKTIEGKKSSPTRPSSLVKNNQQQPLVHLEDAAPASPTLGQVIKKHLDSSAEKAGAGGDLEKSTSSSVINLDHSGHDFGSTPTNKSHEPFSEEMKEKMKEGTLESTASNDMTMTGSVSFFTAAKHMNDQNEAEKKDRSGGDENNNNEDNDQQQQPEHQAINVSGGEEGGGLLSCWKGCSSCCEDDNAIINGEEDNNNNKKPSSIATTAAVSSSPSSPASPDDVTGTDSLAAAFGVGGDTASASSRRRRSTKKSEKFQKQGGKKYSAKLHDSESEGGDNNGDDEEEEEDEEEEGGGKDEKKTTAGGEKKKQEQAPGGEDEEDSADLQMQVSGVNDFEGEDDDALRMEISTTIRDDAGRTGFDKSGVFDGEGDNSPQLFGAEPTMAKFEDPSADASMGSMAKVAGFVAKTRAKRLQKQNASAAAAASSSSTTTTDNKESSFIKNRIAEQGGGGEKEGEGHEMKQKETSASSIRGAASAGKLITPDLHKIETIKHKAVYLTELLNESMETKIMSPIVLRMIKRNLWLQYNDGLLSGTTVTAFAGFIDSRIQKDLWLFSAEDVFDFLTDEANTLTWIDHIERFCVPDHFQAHIETFLVESAIAFTSMMDNVRRTLPLLHAKQTNISVWLNWAKFVDLEAKEYERQMLQNYPATAVHINSRRTAQQILQLARSIVPQTAVMYGLSTHQKAELHDRLFDFAYEALTFPESHSIVHGMRVDGIKPHVAGILKNTPIFYSASQELIDEVAEEIIEFEEAKNNKSHDEDGEEEEHSSCFSKKPLPEGEPIFLTDEIGIVAYGSVSRTNPQGKKTRKFHSSDAFGVNAFIFQVNHPIQFVVNEETQILKIPFSVMDSVCKKDPRVRHHVVVQCAKDVITPFLEKAYPFSALTPAQRFSIISQAKVTRVAHESKKTDFGERDAVFLIRGRQVPAEGVAAAPAISLLPERFNSRYIRGSILVSLHDARLTSQRVPLTGLTCVDNAHLQLDCAFTSFTETAKQTDAFFATDSLLRELHHYMHVAAGLMKLTKNFSHKAGANSPVLSTAPGAMPTTSTLGNATTSVSAAAAAASSSSSSSSSPSKNLTQKQKDILSEFNNLTKIDDESDSIFVVRDGIMELARHARVWMLQRHAGNLNRLYVSHVLAAYFDLVVRRASDWAPRLKQAHELSLAFTSPIGQCFSTSTSAYSLNRAAGGGGDQQLYGSNFVDWADLESFSPAADVVPFMREHGWYSDADIKTLNGWERLNVEGNTSAGADIDEPIPALVSATLQEAEKRTTIFHARARKRAVAAAMRGVTTDVQDLLSQQRLFSRARVQVSHGKSLPGGTSGHDVVAPVQQSGRADSDVSERPAIDNEGLGSAVGSKKASEMYSASKHF